MLRYIVFYGNNLEKFYQKGKRELPIISWLKNCNTIIPINYIKVINKPTKF